MKSYPSAMSLLLELRPIRVQECGEPAWLLTDAGWRVWRRMLGGLRPWCFWRNGGSMSSIMEALKQFEVTEANLLKLERLWDELQTLFPASVSLGHNPEYEDRCRSFDSVLRAFR